MAGKCHYHHANHNHHHHSNDHDHHLHACKNNCDVFYGRQSLSPQYLANHGHRHRDNHHDRHLHACKTSCTYFCAREDELEKMKEYITGPSQKVERIICEDLEYMGDHKRKSAAINVMTKDLLLVVSRLMVISDN